MEVFAKDPIVSSKATPEHCIICWDRLSTAPSVGLQCDTASVTKLPFLWTGGTEAVTPPNSTSDRSRLDYHDATDSLAGPGVDAETGWDDPPNGRTVQVALSAILRPLERPMPAGCGPEDAVCRLCGRLVAQVDLLRRRADGLEARLLARLDSGQTRASEAALPPAPPPPEPAPARAVRVRLPPPPAPQESQNYIAPPPPPPPASERRPTSHSAVISIEICRDDGETSAAAADPDELETDAAADGTPSRSPSPPPPPPPPSPPPADPPPTYVRQEQSSQCGVCERQFDTRASCREHMRAHQAKKVYFCPLCPVALMARNALWAHEEARHADSPLRPYGCGQCGETFPTPRFLQRHKDAAHLVLLPCAHCRRTFRRAEDLHAHQTVHTGQRPYHCNRCGKGFTKQPVWRQHMRTHGRRPRPHQCPQCPRTFLTELHLAVHARRHRTPQLACAQCDRRFTSETRLRKHALKHSGAHTHSCSVCGKSFTKKSLLADHTRTHTGEKPFICEHCGAGFAQRSNLTAHKSAVHLNERPFECAVCKKAFKRKLLLTYHHRAVHSGARPAHCTQCSASFVSDQQLRSHQKTHRAGSKPFCCGVCGRTFASQERCHAHMFSSHSDKRPFECRECGSGFLRRAQLLSHMQELGHGSGPGDYIINQPVLETPVVVKAPGSSQFVVQTVADDGSAIYGQAELTGNASRPPGATEDSLRSLDGRR